MNTKFLKYSVWALSAMAFFFLAFQSHPITEQKLMTYSFEEAVKLQEKEPRKMLIDVYTDRCGWCKKMDKNTFQDPSILGRLNTEFYFVKLNAEQREDIKFRDKNLVYKEEYKSHELALSLLNGKMSYPSVVFLDEDMNLLTVVPGYLDAKEFSPVLDYFGKNHYKKMNWQEYSSGLKK